MMTAKQARELSMKNSYREEAIKYGIAKLEEAIIDFAKRGRTEKIVTFYAYPGTYSEFKEKHPEATREDYRGYNFEEECRNHFTQLGYEFKYVTDDVSGGVRQDPYWIIKW